MVRKKTVSIDDDRDINEVNLAALNKTFKEINQEIYHLITDCTLELEEMSLFRAAF